jgi:hypothetical protein
MGEYINTVDRTKEQFLIAEGREISDPGLVASGELPVCLVDNGIFTAAGIAYDERELKAFTEPEDYRPKRWFAVSIEKLTPFMSKYARDKVAGIDS